MPSLNNNTFHFVKKKKIKFTTQSLAVGHSRGCDHMVVGFTTTCVISAYHH